MADQKEQVIHVKDPEGQPGTIPARDFKQALLDNYQPMSPAEVRELHLKKAYGDGLGNEAKTFAEGAGSGLTFGLSRQIENATGLTTPEEQALRAKYSPNASLAGEITGVAAPLAASALAGPEAPLGVLAANSPVGLVSRVGEAAGDAAHAALGITSASPKVVQLAGKAAAAGLGSAVEGTFYGAGQSVSEDALGDPGLNAEKVLANIGYGGLLGGALGSAMKVGEIGIPATVSKAKDGLSSIASKVLGPSEEAGPIGKLYSRVSSFVSGKDEGAITQAIADRAKISSPEEIQSMTKSLSESLQDQHDTLQKLGKEASGQVKPEVQRKLLESVPVETGKAQFDHAISQIDETIQKIRSEPDLFDQGYARELELQKKGALGRLGENPSSADYYRAIDEIKKNIDTEIKYSSVPSAKEQKVQDVMKGLRGGIKDNLENEQVWGEAAAKQASLNDAVSDHIANSQEFQKTFMKKSVEAGRQVFSINPSKVNKFLKSVGTLDGEARQEILSKWLESSRKLADEAEKLYGSLPDKTFDKASVQRVLSANEAQSAKLLEHAQVRKTLNQLSSGGHNAYLGEGAAFIAGSAHPAFGVGLGAFNMLRNPGLSIQRLAKIENMTQSISKSVARGTDAIFKAGSKVTSESAGYAGGKLSTKELRSQQGETFDRAKELQANPLALMDHLDHSTRELYNVAPNTASGVQLAASRAVQFLSAAAPRQQQVSPLSPKLPPSAAEIGRYQRYIQAIEEPTSVLNHVKDGTLTNDHIQALESVYPKLFGEMKQSVLERLMDEMGKNKTDSMPYKTKISLSLFLGQDLVNSLGQQSIALNQHLLQQTSQPQNQPGQVRPNQSGLSKIKSSETLLTASQANSQRQTS